MAPTEEFLSLFQSYDSDIPQKRRRFNSIIKQLELLAINPEDLSNLILSITPKNAIEELFKIEYVIHFKLYNILITELKQNNPILIKKMLKNWKTFDDLFSNINPQFFVNDILPYLSYTMKLRLLNGISKNVSNEDLVDQYFIEVEKIYGLKLAMSLLQGCTANLIKIKIKRYIIKLSQRQLWHIIKKDKELLMYYLDLLKKKETTSSFYYSYKKVYRKFAKLYPATYWSVNDVHGIPLKFGKRITPTMFRFRNKELKEGHEFLDYFVNLHQLYKVAKKDGQLKEFLVNLFPSTLDDYNTKLNFWYNVLKFVETFPQTEQFALVSSIFKEKYGQNLLDNPEYCKKCLQIIPVQQREPILDILVKDDEELIYFYNPTRSIPTLKSKLQHCADSQERGRLTSLMYKTCRVNNDKNALLQVLDYILIRHKNDIIVLTVLFNNLMHFPDLVKFDVVSWQKIADIVKIFELSRPYYDSSLFYGNYIIHLIQKSIPLEEYCKKRIQEILTSGFYNAFSLQMPKKYLKIYLEETGKYIHLYKDHKNYQIACIYFLYSIICLNRNNKTYSLEFKNYSHLFDQIRTPECYISNDIILRNLKVYPSDDIWHDLFWKTSKHVRNNWTLAWYVQKWPERIATNVGKVLDEMELLKIQRFVKVATKCLDQNTLEKFKMHALNIIFNEDYEKVKLAVTILCFVSPKSLLDIIIPFINNTDSASHTKPSKSEFLLIKLSIKRFHKLGNSRDILPLILKHCSGKYAKHVPSPLNSIAYNSPEIDMREELPKLTDTELCVKKTILSLSKLLFPSNVFAEVLRVFNEKETNISIKNSIFQKTFQCLNENPSDFFWSFLKNCIIFMDSTNLGMYDLLMDTTKLPEQCLPEYIPLVYRIFSNSPYSEIKKNKFKFLENIPAHIYENLDTTFLKEIIRETACLKGESNFHWKCAFYVKTVQQEELFKENFRTLKDFIESNRLYLNSDRKVRIAINSFISRFLEVALEIKESYNLIKIFCTLWTLEIKPYNFYKDYMIVLFTELYFKNNFDAFKTGIDVRQLLQGYVREAGPSIITFFSTQLNDFLNKIDSEKQNKLSKFVEGLFVNETDENIYTLIIYILAKNPPKQDRNNCSTILQTLLKSEISVIKLHLNQFSYLCIKM